MKIMREEYHTFTFLDILTFFIGLSFSFQELLATCPFGNFNRAQRCIWGTQLAGSPGPFGNSDKAKSLKAATSLASKIDLHLESLALQSKYPSPRFSDPRGEELLDVSSSGYNAVKAFTRALRSPR